jgi:type I restriction enzyme S subunit
MATRKVALPPYYEQGMVIEFVQKERAAIDELIYEAQRATELLKERRAALISAAVTGKIDVRQYALCNEHEE